MTTNPTASGNVTFSEVMKRLDQLSVIVAGLADRQTVTPPVTPPVTPVVTDTDVVTATFQHGDKVIGVITMSAKTFVKSGNHGYWGNGKIVLKGRRFQTQSQMVGLKD